VKTAPKIQVTNNNVNAEMNKYFVLTV